MKISYNWLKNYVDFNLTPKDLGEVLTGVGLEVEDIKPFETIPGGLEGVVIGEIMECSKHPDADKLSVTKVDVGSGELLQIVCGAPNVAAGQKVVVALTGSVLYPLNGEKLTIKKAKIRGVESFGMICAEDELGLTDNHQGIMVLDPQTQKGTKAADYFKVEKDFVLDIGLTPNRGDAFSHIGVARDLAVALNVAYKAKVKFNKPVISEFPTRTKEGQIPQSVGAANSKVPPISVEVLDIGACPRYSGISLSEITVGDSPAWLKNKLKAIGVRTINNVVDITNYVLHEYGQPLHAFDADKIRGRKIVVKYEKPGAPFRTLDGNMIKLDAADLMICDAEGGICIAGVFGGAESGVSDATKNIFLESACFSPGKIRKTAARHQLRTDASAHFEKGTDPNITVEALQRAAALILEICGGGISSELIDLYPMPVKGWRLSVSYQRILRLAGFPIEKASIREILQQLEIIIEKEGEDEFDLLVPAFKTEVKREADIVEEIIRILGYNSFTLPKSLKSALSFSAKVDKQKIENIVADMLSGEGLNEILTNSVTQSKFEQHRQLIAERVQLLNSQTAELDSLRTDLMYSGLEVIAYNQNRKNPNLRFYEFGKTYHKIDGRYEERRHLGLWFAGNTFDDNWLGSGEKYNFYHLKTAVSHIFQRLGQVSMAGEYFEKFPYSFGMEMKKEAEVMAGLVCIDKTLLRQFDIKGEVFYADINWDYLLDNSEFNKISYTPVPKFPAVRRDLAMLVNEDLRFEAIESIARAESKNWLQEISLFDVYKGDKIEKGKKSYAVSFLFRHPEKTLTDPEIEKMMGRLMTKYEEALGAIIRKS